MAEKEKDQVTIWESLWSSVQPEGFFRVALHRSSYRVSNLRASRPVGTLGRLDNGRAVTNSGNFPSGQVDVQDTEGVYEIGNPFPFRGATYIGKAWADAKRDHPETIPLAPPAEASMTRWFRDHLPGGTTAESPEALLKALPEPVQLALAVNSTDPEDLVPLAESSAAFVHHPESGLPEGLRFTLGGDGQPQPCIHNLALFEAVANNAALPDSYKAAMVLRPGASGCQWSLPK